MLSIKEVARLTGLSTATVSRALDPRYADRVRPATREKILAVCDSADYRPGMAGRSFVTGKSYKVGFISGDPAGDCGNLLFGHFLKGVSQELQINNYNLLLLGADSGSEQKIVDFLRSNVADAYILGNPLVTDKVADIISRCKAPVLMLEKQQRIPHALILRRNPRPAYKKIWECLAPEQYGEILFCCQSLVKERYNTVMECAPPGVKIPFLQFESGREFAETRSLARKLALARMEQLKKYRIFWCSSDLLALGVKDAFEESCGMKAGKDFFLIGYDNIESKGRFCEKAILSTVDNCMEEMGEKAARMVLSALNGERTVECVDFESLYIERESFFDFRAVKIRR